jgi:hypothetical protein
MHNLLLMKYLIIQQSSSETPWKYLRRRECIFLPSLLGLYYARVKKKAVIFVGKLMKITSLSRRNKITHPRVFWKSEFESGEWWCEVLPSTQVCCYTLCRWCVLSNATMMWRTALQNTVRNVESEGIQINEVRFIPT